MDFANYAELFSALMANADTGAIERLVDAIAEAYEGGNCVFLVGNGGSGANASHICEDLGKGTLSDLDNQKRLRAISLTDNAAYILAWGNDTSFDRVFVEQLKNLGSPGDILIAISGSGNSPNVLRAVEYANANGIKSYGVAGFDGGNLRELAADCWLVESDDMGMVEGVHSAVFHYVTDVLKERFAS